MRAVKPAWLLLWVVVVFIIAMLLAWATTAEEVMFTTPAPWEPAIKVIKHLTPQP